MPFKKYDIKKQRTVPVRREKYTALYRFEGVKDGKCTGMLLSLDNSILSMALFPIAKIEEKRKESR